MREREEMVAGIYMEGLRIIGFLVGDLAGNQVGVNSWGTDLVGHLKGSSSFRRTVGCLDDRF